MGIGMGHGPLTHHGAAGAIPHPCSEPCHFRLPPWSMKLLERICRMLKEPGAGATRTREDVRQVLKWIWIQYLFRHLVSY
jgi:hypothetical protein